MGFLKAGNFGETSEAVCWRKISLLDEGELLSSPGAAGAASVGDCLSDGRLGLRILFVSESDWSLGRGLVKVQDWHHPRGPGFTERTLL